MSLKKHLLLNVELTYDNLSMIKYFSFFLTNSVRNAHRANSVFKFVDADKSKKKAIDLELFQ